MTEADLRLQTPASGPAVWTFQQKTELIKRRRGDSCVNVPVCAMFGERKKKKKKNEWMNENDYPYGTIKT